MSKMFGKKDKQIDSTVEEVTNLVQNQDAFDMPQKEESNLDINLVISSFQERLTQVMTELIIKEATIKQLLAQIEKLKGR
jgi:hypothetical protein